MSRQNVTSRLTVYPATADCETCGFLGEDRIGGPAGAIRLTSRRHVAETGHMVRVTVEHATVYERADETLAQHSREAVR